MGKFRPVCTELSARNTSVFYFQNNNSGNSQWIFTDFDMCNDIVERCFGIAHCQISSIFDKVICPRHDNDGVLPFYVSFKLLSYTRTWRQSHRFGLFPALLRKRVFNYIENFTTKKGKFSDKNSDILHISSQNIDYGNSLEPHRRIGSNVYTHKLFFFFFFFFLAK